MKVKLLIATAAVLAFAVMEGAAAAQDEISLEGKVIGITTIRSDNHADRLFYQNAVREAERLGAEVIALDAQSNDQTQVSQIQTLIAQQPDAIIEVLGNVDVLNPWLARIKEAGIPLVTIDTNSPSADNVVASNNYTIGIDYALQLVADIGAEGNVLVFNGFYNVPPCRIRYDMLMYVLQDFPAVNVIQPELRDVIPNTAQRAYSDMTDMLTKYSDEGEIDAVWACWDVPLIGATQAIDAAGRGSSIGTYGVDGSADFMVMIEDPDSAASAVVIQDLVRIGETAVHNAGRLINGEEVEPFTFVPHILVTKSNAAEVIPTLPAME